MDIVIPFINIPLLKYIPYFNKYTFLYFKIYPNVQIFVLVFISFKGIHSMLRNHWHWWWAVWSVLL